jgi:glutamate--cysteine ligase
MTAQTLGVVAGQVALSEPAAEAWIPHTCFTHGPPGRIGLELEQLVVPAEAHGARPDGLAGLHTRLARLPLASALTVEPGGQLELSSSPAVNLSAAVRDLAGDLRLLARSAARLGWRLGGEALHPGALPSRILDRPRYAAM